MTIGKISPPTRPSHGHNNMIQETHKIVGLKDECNKKTRSSDKNKRKIISKPSKIW